MEKEMFFLIPNKRLTKILSFCKEFNYDSLPSHSVLGERFFMITSVEITEEEINLVKKKRLLVEEKYRPLISNFINDKRPTFIIIKGRELKSSVKGLSGDLYIMNKILSMKTTDGNKN